VRGRAAEGGRGSLTRHLELELGNMTEVRGCFHLVLPAEYRTK
jgi:hypothetical protein